VRRPGPYIASPALHRRMAGAYDLFLRPLTK
jgi:hypothetical protein